jgi:hypothetical protein
VRPKAPPLPTDDFLLDAEQAAKRLGMSTNRFHGYWRRWRLLIEGACARSVSGEGAGHLRWSLWFVVRHIHEELRQGAPALTQSEADALLKKHVPERPDLLLGAAA